MNSVLVQRTPAVAGAAAATTRKLSSARQTQRPCVVFCSSFQNPHLSLKSICGAEQRVHSFPSASLSSRSVAEAVVSRPSSAEAARTLIDVCTEGVLCTCSIPEGWPIGSAVRFAVDPEEGSPIFHLHPSVFHSQHLQADPRCSLHIQIEQPGHRKPQCTFKGRILKVEDGSLKQKFKTIWDQRFGEEAKEGSSFHVMEIDSILQSLDIVEDSIWVSSKDYKEATPDPLRECAAKIVEDVNRNHWEDVRHFCNVFAHLNLSVEEARLSWVDRLGFDMRVLTTSHELIEVRIPFCREVVDEREARSSLTMMAQISWEYERNYNPPEIQLLRS